MPFGLINGPVTFKTFVNQVFRRVFLENCNRNFTDCRVFFLFFVFFFVVVFFFFLNTFSLNSSRQFNATKDTLKIKFLQALDKDYFSSTIFTRVFYM